MKVDSLFIFTLFLVISEIAQGQTDSKLKDTTTGLYRVIRTCSPNYPKKAEENDIEGTVLVQFDIDSNCTFVNFKILKSLGYGCDEEAIKAIKCRVIYRGGDLSKCRPLYNLRQAVLFKNPKEQE